MDKAQKTAFIGELSERLERTPFLALVDFRGVTVAKTNALRRELEKDGLEFKVVKNTLIKKAITGTQMEGLSTLLQGMTGMILSNEDPVASAKLLRDKVLNVKDSPIVLKGGYFDGEVLSPEKVPMVADMPSKEQLQATLLSLLQSGPRDLLGVIQAPARDLLYLLKNYENKLAETGGNE